jgi:hypothetical protein
MEKIVMQALLYDFYGELLNEHQKSIYDDYVNNDIGLSEIASERGISRQSVHDLIKRCQKTLEEYEEKLHLVEKFEKTKSLAGQIRDLTDGFGKGDDKEIIEEIRKISSELTEI